MCFKLCREYADTTKSTISPQPCHCCVLTPPFSRTHRPLHILRTTALRQLRLVPSCALATCLCDPWPTLTAESDPEHDSVIIGRTCSRGWNFWPTSRGYRSMGEFTRLAVCAFITQSLDQSIRSPRTYAPAHGRGCCKRGRFAP